MKRKLYSIFALFIFLASIFNLNVLADETPLKWSVSEKTKTITVTEGKSLVYTYTPSKTGEYAVKYTRDVPLDYELSVSDIEYPEHVNWMDEANNSYDIYTLTAGKEYTVSFFYSGPDNRYNGKYTGKVSIIEWENKIVLPDYPYIKENEQKKLTLSQNETAYFLFSPSVSGTYCTGQNYTDFHIGIGPLPKAPNVAGHDPGDKGEWKTDSQNGRLFHLEKGETYLFCVSSYRDGKSTDTVWIRQGEAPKDKYPVWKANETKTITLKKGKFVKYSFIPPETGRYMVFTGNGLKFSIQEEFDSDLGEEFAATDNRYGQLYELVKGKEYVVCVEEWGSFKDSITSTVKIEKAGPLKSASLYVSLFDRFGYIIGIDTDPICGTFDGVKWSVSDPSVFSIRESHNNYVELNVLKKGTATITAKVGHLTATMELNSEHKTPVLTEGKTFNMTLQNVAGAVFTPSKTGKYQFTVTPQNSVIFHLFGDLNDSALFTKADFSDKTVFTVNLTAGQTYTLMQISGRCSVLVNSVGTAFIPNANASSQTASKPDSITQNTSSKESDSSQNESVNTDTSWLQTSSKEDTMSDASSSFETEITDNHITKNDVEEEIIFATDKVISFNVMGDNEDLKIDVDAITAAANANCEISVRFPENITVKLDNDVLKNLGGSLVGENLSLVAKRQDLGSLNEKQKKALEGKNTNMLLDVGLMLGQDATHQLGGKATISFPNPNTNEDWSVLYVAKDGSLESMDVFCDENITFDTEHFSHYVLVSNEKTASVDYVEWIIPTLIAGIIFGGVVIILLVLRKKKITEKQENA